MNVLAVSERDILELSGRGGEPFADLINRLLQAEAAMAGAPGAAVTSLRVDERDGGVDARLDVSRPSPAGWFASPTCWQYKSGSLPPRKASAEVNKPYVRELLGQGYAYRVCLRAGLTPLKRANLEKALIAAVAKINSDAPPPRVLDAGNLADWCSQYPALVISQFKPHLGNALHFDTWRNVARASTESFIADERFERMRTVIQEHLRFAELPASAVITVGGAPGSGRGRLVFESIAGTGVEPLLLYADTDAQADSITTTLVNETSTQAVVVARECDAATVARLRERLSGSRKRIRMIAIAPADTAEDRYDVWVDRPEREVIKRIIDSNFSAVEETRRHALMELGHPYLPVILELLARESLTRQGGDLARVIDPLSRTIDASIRPEEREALAIAALVDRVDLRAESSEQLAALARVADRTEKELRILLSSLHARRLFSGDEEDVIHVEPAAVASVLFRDAWWRWGTSIGADEQLRLAVLARAAKCHDVDVRESVALQHERWMHRVRTADLASEELAHRFVVLVEIDPPAYLPVLVKMMESATPKALRDFAGRSSVTRLCDGLAGFPECFDGVERVLFRLALFETQTFMNNATYYWTGLFAVALSSTTVPFADRLKRLESRLAHAVAAGELDLAFHGLSIMFSNYYWRLAPESYVGGRLRPTEPLPSESAFRADRWSAFALLQQLVATQRDELRARAIALVMEKLWFFLSEGLLAELREIVTPSVLTEAELQKTLTTVRDFVSVYDDQRETNTYLDDVRSWIDGLFPPGSEQRVWKFFTRDQDPDELEPEAVEIAPDLLRSDIDFAQVQRVVERGNAYRAVLLGNALGVIDEHASRLIEIVAAAKPAQGFSFYGGYVRTLLVHHPQHSGAVNALLDQLEASDPEVCAEIALGGWRDTQALERLIRLIDEGKVDPRRARDLAASGERGFSAAEFAQVLDLLRSKADRAPSAADTGLEMIWWRLHSRGQADAVELEAVTRFIDSVTLTDSSADNRRHWGMAIEELAKHDPATAVLLAAKGLGSGSEDVQFRAQKLLAALAKDDPAGVASAVGRAIVAREGPGWYFIRLSALYRALPSDTVKTWLDQTGVEGARAIASHLPWPRVVDGQPFVPPVTEYVLGAFEEDDEVFTAFCRGEVVRSYIGDIEEEHLKEAEKWRMFLNHPLRRIREWASDEVDQAKRSAEYWRDGKRKRKRRTKAGAKSI